MKQTYSHRFGTTWLRSTTVLFLLVVGFSFGTPKTASATSLHHSEAFLDSLYRQSRIEAPRVGLSALKTYLAHPSYLDRWGITASDAAAQYNDWTNTLVLKPEMTIAEPTSGEVRIRTLSEIYQSVGTFASVTAAVIFHELSHAEYDLFVEEGAESYDRELMSVLTEEARKIASDNRLGPLRSRALASEIFAYYREDLIGMILSDTNEIKLASGLHPDTNECVPRTKRPEEARNFSPTPVPYYQRSKLKIAFVTGKDVNLDLDHAANERLNSALEKHSRATLRFPETRVALLERLRKDPEIRAAMDRCRLSN